MSILDKPMNEMTLKDSMKINGVASLFVIVPYVGFIAYSVVKDKWNTRKHKTID